MNNTDNLVTMQCSGGKPQTWHLASSHSSMATDSCGLPQQENGIISSKSCSEKTGETHSYSPDSVQMFISTHISQHTGPKVSAVEVSSNMSECKGVLTSSQSACVADKICPVLLREPYHMMKNNSPLVMFEHDCGVWCEIGVHSTV